jgi:hypothetical protein
LESDDLLIHALFHSCIGLLMTTTLRYTAFDIFGPPIRRLLSTMRSLPRGIYTPLPCFFTETEDVGKYTGKNSQQDEDLT